MVSIDGVQQNKSSHRSLHMYCIRFVGCSRIYFVAVERGKIGYHVDHMKMVARFVDDIM